VPEAIYNARRLRMAKFLRPRPSRICLTALLFLPCFLLADDMGTAEVQLAHKIAAITGPGAVALSVENRSALTPKEVESVRAGMRAALETVSVHIVADDQAAASVSVTLSENPQLYVWSALIKVGNDVSSTLISTPRPERSALKSDAFVVTLRKSLLWEQADPILDVAVLQDKPSMEIAVLDSEAITFYAQRGNQWMMEQRLTVSHNNPWPRDLRGRLFVSRDRTVEAYLPGVRCETSKKSLLTLDCRNSDDPWPIGDVSGVTPQSAFYTAKRNFFTGDVTPHIGKLATVPKFYSAAAIPRAGYVLWLFSGTDGLLHLVDGLSDQALKQSWGSDIAAIKSGCGAGWTLLATEESGSGVVRAYDMPDREPVAASAPMELDGAVTALWAADDAESGVVIGWNREIGKYEAYRLQVACGQ
jgi:hypothetical protein